MEVECLDVSVYVYEVQRGTVWGKRRAGKERKVDCKAGYFCEQAGAVLSLGNTRKLWIKVKCREV